MADILFNKIDFHRFSEGIIQKVNNLVDRIDRSEFKSKETVQIVNKISQQLKQKSVTLEEDKVYQNEPKDVEIKRQSDVPGSGYRTYSGTSFTFILPFNGNATLLDVQPSHYSSNPPHGRTVGNEIHFEYHILASTDKKGVMDLYNSNLTNLKKWVQCINNDVDGFNTAVQGK
jgi:hypothetical protein